MKCACSSSNCLKTNTRRSTLSGRCACSQLHRCCSTACKTWPLPWWTWGAHPYIPRGRCPAPACHGWACLHLSNSITKPAMKSWLRSWAQGGKFFIMQITSCDFCFKHAGKMNWCSGCLTKNFFVWCLQFSRAGQTRTTILRLNYHL